MIEERDGFYMDNGRTFVPKDVWEKALTRAEGKELPLTDRPGGKVIGTATVHDGEFQMTVTDPAMKELLTGSMPMTGLSIYGQPAEHVWATSPGAQEVVDTMYRLPLTDAHIDRIMSSKKAH